MEENENIEQPINSMNEDMFVNNFVHKIVIPVINSNTGIKKNYIFGLKEISGYDEDKLSSTAIVKTGTKIQFKTEEANIAYLKTCLVEAPFDINEENIRKLTAKIRNKLLEEAKRINEVTVETAKK